MKEDLMRLIPNFPGYFATKEGKIWSVPKARSSKNGKFLKLKKDKEGYLQILLCKNGKKFNKYVHRLVLETFIGPCPLGMECCHNNGNPQDNRLSNLRWDTPKNNHKDAVKHGIHTGLICGEECGASKLTEKKVKEIRKLYKTKQFYQKEIAKIYGVGITTISEIVNRKRWKHI